MYSSTTSNSNAAARPDIKQKSPPKSPSPLDTLPVYNVLLLGPAQAGKSTFLESVKLYADPTHVVETTRIGNGNKTCTQDVRCEMVTTNLPIYRLYDLDDDNREVDISTILLEESEKTFKKLLDREEDLDLYKEEVPGSTWAQFRFFDTPGLDDTNGNDVQNVAKIFSSLSNVKVFHMILILSSCRVPLTETQVAAYKTYFDLFTELRGLITVIHTNVPNIDRDPRNMKWKPMLSERSEFFNGVMGGEVPTKKIDCDLTETGPVQICLTQNTIREILEISTVKTPAIMSRTNVRKLPKMTSVDALLHRKCQLKLGPIHKACDALDDKPSQLAIKIEDNERIVKQLEKSISKYDTDELLVLFEKRINEELTFRGWCRDLRGFVRLHEMEFPQQTYTIVQKSELQRSIKKLEESGGENKTYWKLRFKKRSFQSGYYHVVLSTTRRIKYEEDIHQWTLARDRLNEFLLELKNKACTNLNDCSQMNTNDIYFSGKVEELKKGLSIFSQILHYTAEETLPLDLFLELANKGIYRGSDTQSVDALEKHLAEKFENERNRLLPGP
ncbi:hypothetical protein BGZ65_002152 [Modicella reniformis]|uniref:G domain-containing protein n=1 Tax=Modicella reniformis TaxID=1440133 RepID=A0A9P6M0L1_9FUNG|nr:hypothetical protein BGZ65_002152 [Modicella reniformis]